MRRRKGGRRKRQPQQASTTALSSQNSAGKQEDSGTLSESSSDISVLDHLDQSSEFAHHTLSPSLLGLAIYIYRWIYSLWISYSLLDLWDWVERMVLGLSSVWSSSEPQLGEEGEEEGTELVEQSKGKAKKVKRRRRKDAPASNGG